MAKRKGTVKLEDLLLLRGSGVEAVAIHVDDQNPTVTSTEQIPANSIVVGVIYVVTENFNGTGTKTFQAGYTGTAAAYGTFGDQIGNDWFQPGENLVGAFSAAARTPSVTYQGTGPVTAGKAVVVFLFVEVGAQPA